MTGCDIWPGPYYGNGYGRAPKPGGGWIGAHVLAVLLDGREVPSGHHVHHACGNVACINPVHLEVLAPAEHLARHRPHAARDRAATCANGHPRERSVFKRDGQVAYCRDCRNAQRRARPTDDLSRAADRARAARSYLRRKHGT